MRWLGLLLIFCCSSVFAQWPLFYTGFETDVVGAFDCDPTVCDFKSHFSGLPATEEQSAEQSCQGSYSSKLTHTYPNAYRSELVLFRRSNDGTNNYRRMEDGNEYWFGFAQYAPTTLTDPGTTKSKNVIIWQIHDDTPDACDYPDTVASIPLEMGVKDGLINIKLRTQGGTEVCSTGPTSGPPRTNIAPMVEGQWNRFTVRYKQDVANNGANGVVQVWLNDTLVYTYNGKFGYRHNTEPNSDAFMKTGLYRAGCTYPANPCTIPTMTIYVDEFRAIEGTNQFDTVNPPVCGEAPPPSGTPSNGIPDGQGLEFPISDNNGVRAIYERPLIGDSDTCRSGWDCLNSREPISDGVGDAPNCTGASAVNPDSADEYIIKDCAGFANVNSYKRRFVCPLNCDTTSVTLTNSGTDGDENWLGWWTDSNFDETTVPKQMAVADRAQIDDLIINGADYTVIDRLWIEGEIDIIDSSISTDNIISRSDLRESDADDIVYIGIDNPRNYILNSILFGCTYTPGTPYAAVKVRKGSHDTRIVKSQLVNCPIGVYAPDAGATDYLDALTIEYNDIVYGDGELTDGAGNIVADGDYVCGGPGIVIYSPQSGTTSAEWTRIERNIGWRLKKGDPACAGALDAGGLVYAAGNANYGLVRRNIISENTIALFTAGANVSNWSFIQNIGYNINSSVANSYFIDATNLDMFEAYFNTCHTCDSPIKRGNKGEWKGNVVIDSGALAGTWGTGGTEDYNTYTNSTAGAESNVLEYTNAQWTPVFDDFTYSRQVVAGPVLETIPDIIPTASSPEPFKSFMGTNNANLNPGAGLGVE